MSAHDDSMPSTVGLRAPARLRAELHIHAAAAEQELFGTRSSDGGEHPGPSARAGLELGRFVLRRKLGEGGMGAVYQAHDARLSRDVAIKLSLVARGDAHEKRLVREATALAQLNHPNVVQVHEVGTAAGQVFIVMELVSGRNLSRWLEEAERGVHEVLDVFTQAALGLAAAHAEGIVHRDFKPGNVVVGEDGRARVVDFGLATDDASPSSSRSTLEAPTSDSSRPRLSSTVSSGFVSGTPPYMPPEQHRGNRVDARSDQFSFCAALFEALYGARPFPARDPTVLLEDKLAGRIQVPADARDVPAHVHRAILRGLSADPTERFGSMDELRELLLDDPARRWRRRGAAMLVLGVVAASVGWGVWRRPDERCTGSAERLVGVWDEERRAEVEASVSNTGLSYAPMTRSMVVAALDDYAERWTAARTEACRASVVREEQTREQMDLRMTCLRHRREALRATVDQLVRIDREGLSKAVGVVEGLPSVGRCDDLETLRKTIPPPSEPEVAEAAEDVARRLAEAHARIGAGVIKPVLPILDGLVADANALEHPPRLAEVLLERAIAREKAGRFSDAEEDLLRAYALAARSEHDEVAALASTWLIRVVGYQQARHVEGAQWGVVALPLARRSGIDVKVEARGLSFLGHLKMVRGDRLGGQRDYEEALAILEDALGPDHLELAVPLNSIGVSLDQGGDYEGALVHLRRALEIQERALGPTHPDVAATLSNIGNALMDGPQLEDALDVLERSLAISSESLGADHPNVGIAHVGLGNLFVSMRRFDESLEHQRIAVDTFRRALGPRHPYVTTTTRNIAAVLKLQGKLTDALDVLREVLPLVEAELGPEHPEVAATLIGLVDLHLQIDASEDPALVRDYAERALAIREAGQGTPAERGEARFWLAAALWLQPDERPRALAIAEQAQQELAEASAELPMVDSWLA